MLVQPTLLDSLERDLLLLATGRSPFGANHLAKAAAAEKLEEGVLLLLLEALGLCEEVIAELGRETHNVVWYGCVLEKEEEKFVYKRWMCDGRSKESCQYGRGVFSTAE